MILDLFAGPGGWSEGLRALGRQDVGLEYDQAACETRAAAGHLTIRADISTYLADRFVGAEGLIASPPCQDFSMAGKRAGRNGDRGQLIDLVPEWVDIIRPEWIACEQVPPCLPIWREHGERYRELGYSVWCGILNAANYGVPQTRKRAILIASRVRPVTPPEPTHAREPGYSLFGQLEPWVSMADALGWGMTEWPCSTIVASNRPNGGGPDPLSGGAGAREHLRRERAEGRWSGKPGDVRVGFPRLDDTGTSDDGYRDRDWRTGDEPSFALTEKARSWVLKERQAHGAERRLDEPAMTISASADNGNFAWTLNTGRDWKPGGTRDDAQKVPTSAPAPALSGQSNAWWLSRPATTIVGSFCPDIVAAPGYRLAGDGPRQDAEGSIRITTVDALVLQSFRPDYPVAGSKTKQFEQIGNAIPPRLAEAILRQLV